MGAGLGMLGWRGTNQKTRGLEYSEQDWAQFVTALAGFLVLFSPPSILLPFPPPSSSPSLFHISFFPFLSVLLPTPAGQD